MDEHGRLVPQSTTMMHVIAVLQQSFHIIPSYSHSCDDLEIIILQIIGGNPCRRVEDLHHSIHLTWCGNTSRGELEFTQQVKDACVTQETKSEQSLCITVLTLFFFNKGLRI